jgi:serpin B
VYAWLAAGALLLSGCGDATAPNGSTPSPLDALPRTLTALEQEAISASNTFGFALLREVAADKPNQNVVLSPFSAHVALGMAYAGADGSTADSMRAALGWGTRSREEILAGYKELPGLILSLDSQVDLRNANSLWVRQGFAILPSYTSEMQSVFDAEVRTGDFGQSTVDAMNAWASEKTNGKIPKVVESLGTDLVAMLMNALYFKASWRDRFDAAQSRDVPFATADGATPSVRMMFRSDKNMGYREAFGAQWAELPYGNTAFVMTLVLPSSTTTPRQWLQGVDAAQFQNTVQRFDSAKVELALPKFRLPLKFSLTQPLSRMGMDIAFRDGDANFTRIANDRLSISHVTQDVYIDVNEEGTEAAAVTQVGVRATSAPILPVMRLDRPFLFFIRERLSGTILFAGIIENPQM